MDAPNLEIVVSESGWPFPGGDGALVENAHAYYFNLINHANSGSGTPKRPRCADDLNWNSKTNHDGDSRSKIV
ncbi:hypothetical protein JHK87_044971 [Glycine soja]|nr:hypothetical protein JHK87_044971 [Glycine soja]